MRLNPNQIRNSVKNAMKALREQTDGLHEDDIRQVLDACRKILLPNEAEPETEITAEGMQQMIQKAMRDGLDRSDPQMVRAAMQWLEEQAGREYLNELTVNI